MFVIADGHPARISQWNPNNYRSSRTQMINMKEQQLKLDECKELCSHSSNYFTCSTYCDYHHCIC